MKRVIHEFDFKVKVELPKCTSRDLFVEVWQGDDVRTDRCALNSNAEESLAVLKSRSVWVFTDVNDLKKKR